MSDELRLPDDLAAMEARLAAHAPPASGLNRDELMYRAGWAAAEENLANLRLATAASSPHHSSRHARSTAAWSLASAALAASLAVAVTLLVQSPPQAPLPLAPAIAVQPATVAPLAAPSPRADDVADYLASMSRSNSPLAGALLVMHRRPDATGSRSSEATELLNDVAAPAPKTARDLRQEFLPAPTPASPGSASPALGWPWNARLFGEST